MANSICFSEALPETTIADLFFAHERATYMGWYAWTLTGSNFFAPIICGFINDSMGYGWVFYFPAIFCAATCAFLFLFMEETNYDRATLGNVPTVTGSEAAAGYVSEKKGSEEGGESTSPVESPDESPEPVGDIVGKPKSFWQRMSIIDKPRPFMMHYRAWQSLKLLSWPVVLYSGFSYGTYLIWGSILNATSSIILGGEPYNFSPAMIGLTYTSCMVGATVG